MAIRPDAPHGSAADRASGGDWAQGGQDARQAWGAQLRDGLNRFTFLLGGSDDGERPFGP
jgi:hypothetical protein